MPRRLTTSRCAMVILTALWACSGPYGRVKETQNPTISPDRFKNLVVIAGESDQGDQQIAARVREALTDAGLTIVSRRGTWETEEQSLMDICPLGAGTGLDGVLFVWWNRMTLRDCETHRTAYHVDAAYTGTENMIKRLLGYLRRPYTR